MSCLMKLNRPSSFDTVWNIDAAAAVFRQTRKHALRDNIMKSGADYIRSQLQKVSSDVRATWRTAKNLLPSGSGLFTMTRNVPTLSTSSVISSLTKSSAFVTTSQQLYSSPLTDCLPLERTPDCSCRLFNR